MLLSVSSFTSVSIYCINLDLLILGAHILVIAILFRGIDLFFIVHLLAVSLETVLDLKALVAICMKYLLQSLNFYHICFKCKN